MELVETCICCLGYCVGAYLVTEFTHMQPTPRLKVVMIEVLHQPTQSTCMGIKIYVNTFIKKTICICCLGYEVVLLLVSEFSLIQRTPRVKVIMNEAFYKSIQSTCMGIRIYIITFILNTICYCCLGSEVVLFWLRKLPPVTDTMCEGHNH